MCWKHNTASSDGHMRLHISATINFNGTTHLWIAPGCDVNKSGRRPRSSAGGNVKLCVFSVGFLVLRGKQKIFLRKCWRSPDQYFILSYTYILYTYISFYFTNFYPCIDLCIYDISNSELNILFMKKMVLLLTNQSNKKNFFFDFAFLFLPYYFFSKFIKINLYYSTLSPTSYLGQKKKTTH